MLELLRRYHIREYTKTENCALCPQLSDSHDRVWGRPLLFRVLCSLQVAVALSDFHSSLIRVEERRQELLLFGHI